MKSLQDRETEAESFRRSLGSQQQWQDGGVCVWGGGGGDCGLWPQNGALPPRRGHCHRHRQVRELPGSCAPSPVAGRGVGFKELRMVAHGGVGHPGREKRKEERGKGEKAEEEGCGVRR